MSRQRSTGLAQDKVAAKVPDSLHGLHVNDFLNVYNTSLSS